MIIRELVASEYDSQVPRLAEILVDAVDSGAGVTFMWPLAQDVAENYWRSQHASIATGQTVQFVAEENGVITGTVMLQRAWAPNQPHRCDVAKLLVHRDFRRRGLGSRLMEALERKARALGLTLITFDAVAHGGAEAFYRDMGFTCAGYIPEYAYAKGSLDDTALFYKLLKRP
jgi:GNAT superfamily N-acetyltransferase